MRICQFMWNQPLIINFHRLTNSLKAIRAAAWKMMRFVYEAR
jgi:hypothetical protein